MILIPPDLISILMPPNPVALAMYTSDHVTLAAPCDAYSAENMTTFVVALEINGGPRAGWLFWVTSYGFVLPKKGVRNEGFMSSFDYDSLHCKWMN